MDEEDLLHILGVNGLHVNCRVKAEGERVVYVIQEASRDVTVKRKRGNGGLMYVS